mmetsp:Transcript_16703/g.31276  ORF Transcript_16703/g.31276 Transcript_16703/m.31276 type:complete len:277 (-) Transcript_16703:74-904(-)
MKSGAHIEHPKELFLVNVAGTISINFVHHLLRISIRQVLVARCHLPALEELLKVEPELGDSYASVAVHVALLPLVLEVLTEELVCVFIDLVLAGKHRIVDLVLDVFRGLRKELHELLLVGLVLLICQPVGTVNLGVKLHVVLRSVARLRLLGERVAVQKDHLLHELPWAAVVGCVVERQATLFILLHHGMPCLGLEELLLEIFEVHSLDEAVIDQRFLVILAIRLYVRHAELFLGEVFCLVEGWGGQVGEDLGQEQLMLMGGGNLSVQTMVTSFFG